MNKNLLLILFLCILPLITAGCLQKGNSKNNNQDDKKLDTDGDLIPDYYDTDDDNDGMSDEWELKYGLNIKK